MISELLITVFRVFSQPTQSTFLSYVDMCGTNNEKTDDSINRINRPVSSSTSSSGSSESNNRVESSLDGRTGSLQTEEKQLPTSCRDNHEHCHIWAASDYCNLHKKYMEENCKASCKVCQTDNDNGYAQESSQTTTNKQNSSDKDAERGDNSQTGRVTITEPPCRDEITTCQGWVDAGLCERRADYMKVYCVKSCKFCTSADDTTTTTTTSTTTTTQASVTTDCKDRNSYCPTWAKQNKCDLYKGYMDRNCQLSCGKCTSSSQSSSAIAEDSVSSDCQDKHSYCKIWAGKGFCSIRKDYMGRICPAACDMCS